MLAMASLSDMSASNIERELLSNRSWPRAIDLV
jgi:hypothetical protein